MTFKTLYAVVALSFALGTNPVIIQGVQASTFSSVPSLLGGGDAEAQIQSAITHLQDLPSGYQGDLEEAAASLKDQKGKLPGDQFTPLLALFVPGVWAVNGSIEAYGIMQQACSGNQELKKSVPQPFDTRRIVEGNHARDHSCIVQGEEDFGEGMADFHQGLGASTLRHKVNKLVRDLNVVQDSLPRAFDIHCRLLTEKFEREVAKLESTVEKTKTAFGEINDLYPGDRDLAPDALAGDLETLKAGIANYKTAVKAYGDALTAAKKWQTSFDKLTATHQTLGETLRGILTEFQDLRTTNEDNPNLPRDNPVLTDISTIGELPALQEAIAADKETMRAVQGQLALAKKWKPPTE
jgi:hypothetical protein